MPILIQANAGLPELRDDVAVYPESPEFMAEKSKALVDRGRDHRRMLRHYPRPHTRNASNDRRGSLGFNPRTKVEYNKGPVRTIVLDGRRMTKLLLTGVFKPYGVDDEYGEVLCSMELLNNQVTREQGIHSPRSNNQTFGLYVLAENVKVPTTVLDFPSWDDFKKEIAKQYTTWAYRSSCPMYSKQSAWLSTSVKLRRGRRSCSAAMALPSPT